MKLWTCCLLSLFCFFPGVVDGLGSSVLPQLLEQLSTAETCADCDSLVTTLKQTAESDADFIELLTELCDAEGTEDPDVCAGLMALEGPHLAYAVRNMTVGSRTAQIFCINNLGICTYPTASAYNITLPPPPPPSPRKPAIPAARPAARKAPPLKIVQYSDIHVDHNYTVGANFNCTKNICCRAYTTLDAPGNTAFPAGPNGNSNCDSTVVLEESMYAAINQFAPDAALAIFTGDIVEGDTWETTDASNQFDITDAYARMRKLALPGVFPAVGNHESSPVNQFALEGDAVPANISTQWVFDTLAASWAPFLPPSTNMTIHATGSYAATPSHLPGLRIVSLNTMLSMKVNYHTYTTDTPGLPALQFLANELALAEAADQHVWITGHMPMGHTDALHDPSRTFHDIVVRYKDTVAGAFYGHTHKDEWEISYAHTTPSPTNSSFGPEHSGPSVMGYIAGAMTPTSGNPGFRVYTVDAGDFSILDFEVFITNTSHPSFNSNHTPPQWERYYSAREVYGPLVGLKEEDGLTPAFWDKVTQVLQDDEVEYDQYLLRKFKGKDMGPCTGACRGADVCQLRAGRAEDNCEVFTAGITFSKRDGDEGAGASASVGISKGQAVECGGALFGKVVKNLVGLRKHRV